MIVVDTSAVVAAMMARPSNPSLRERLGDDGDLHAPHLVDVEFLQALRRLIRTGQVTEDRAADARGDFTELQLTRYPPHLWPTGCGNYVRT